jgi:cytochrome c556
MRLPFAFLACLAAAPLVAQDLTPEQQNAITARKAHMGLYSFYLAPMGQMVQGNRDYDAEIAAAAAQNLAAMAAIDQSAFWVDGTDSDATDTRARPEIWSDPDGYMTVKQNMADVTAALAAVAGDGLEAMQAAFGPVGQSCGACHQNFRAPEN